MRQTAFAVERVPLGSDRMETRAKCRTRKCHRTKSGVRLSPQQPHLARCRGPRRVLSGGAGDWHVATPARCAWNEAILAGGSMLAGRRGSATASCVTLWREQEVRQTRSNRPCDRSQLRSSASRPCTLGLSWSLRLRMPLALSGASAWHHALCAAQSDSTSQLLKVSGPGGWGTSRDSEGSRGAHS
jgi:hypothetical protein